MSFACQTCRDTGKVLSHQPTIYCICGHIAKELEEIRANPTDTTEHVDVILLAMDLYLRAGGQPEHLLRDLQAKQQINFGRKWVVNDGVCEHVREGE